MWGQLRRWEKYIQRQCCYGQEGCQIGVCNLFFLFLSHEGWYLLVYLRKRGKRFQFCINRHIELPTGNHSGHFTFLNRHWREKKFTKSNCKSSYAWRSFSLAHIQLLRSGHSSTSQPVLCVVFHFFISNYNIFFRGLIEHVMVRENYFRRHQQKET